MDAVGAGVNDSVAGGQERQSANGEILVARAEPQASHLAFGLTCMEMGKAHEATT